MCREEQLTLLQSGEEYDVLVIGGGATGVGVALDASTRGVYICSFTPHHTTLHHTPHNSDSIKFVFLRSHNNLEE